MEGRGGSSGDWLLFDLLQDPEERADLLANFSAEGAAPVPPLDEAKAAQSEGEGEARPPLPWAPPPWSHESLVALRHELRRELQAHGERTAPALSWLTPGDPQASPALHQGLWVPWLEPAYAPITPSSSG